MERSKELQDYLDVVTTLIQSGIHRPMKNEHNYAESNKDFIVSTFKKLAAGQEIYFPQFKSDRLNLFYGILIDDLPTLYSGLYLIKEVREDGKYPFYVGYTSQNFSTRLGKNSRHEIIEWYIKQERGTRYLEFDLVPTFNPSHGKLLESVFLDAFDFCRNQHENGILRDLPHPCPRQNTVDISKTYFDQAYYGVFKEICDLCVYHYRTK